MKPATTLFIPAKPKARGASKSRRKSAPPRESGARTVHDAPQGKAHAPHADHEDPVVPRPSQLDGRWLNYVKSFIRDIPDFPKPGILFKDITPMLADPRAFHIVLDSLAERFIGEHIDAVVGIDARGFIFGGALAARLNASFVPARKPGKLPALVDKVAYKTEYSVAELEMHKDSIHEESRVIVVDDLLATGGTAKAGAELVRRQGGYVVGYAFVLELAFLRGREKLLPVRVESVITY
jgi:adenine phosphoribosyltransferase